jgi:hypothetical protein
LRRDRGNPHIRRCKTSRSEFIVATHYVPSIVPAQYPAFQHVCGGRLPKTHAEFEERNHRDARGGGHKIIAVAIEPGELQQYCRDTGCQADGTALDNLAFKKGSEKERG